MLQTLAVTSVAQGFDASAKQIEDLKTNLNAPVDEAGLITADMALPQGTAATDTLADGDVGGHLRYRSRSGGGRAGAERVEAAGAYRAEAADPDKAEDATSWLIER